MGPRWQIVLGCLSILAAAVHAAPGAASTMDAMVIARSNDQESSTVPANTEPATDEPSPPIKLTEMTVTSDVMLRYAHTAVVTNVRNPAKKSQEAVFRVLLPETAFISGFTMTLDGKSYKAYVKEKEEAQQIYNQAVVQGLGAAHVAAKARDSNQFTVSVNVEPNTVAVFNLTYEELLTRRNGVYNHAINLHPGGVVPQMTVTVNLRETSNITDLRVPEIRTGNEIDATADDAQNTKAVIERTQNGREAKITFKPDLEEQQKLMDVYWQKTKHTGHEYNDYGELQSTDEKTGVIGQFVVQYDVDRPTTGEILVNDGYFVHFFAPTDLPPLKKHVVFVLDTSGSMMGRKIAQLRDAMKTILSELNAGDYFSIVEFASTVKVHELKEADEQPTKSSTYMYATGWEHTSVTLVPPFAASPDNIEKAKTIVSRLDAKGGTNIYGALNVAVDLVNKGVGWTQAEPTAEAEASTAAATTDAPQNDTQETKEETRQLEPIIIFLTDGDPTVGETDPTRIINHLTEKNTGRNRATIFSLAFGEDADRKFLRKLSLRNEGFMRHIYEAADAALQLRDFYRQVASPLLADVKFVYPKKQVKENTLTKHRFQAYYGGSEAVVAGRVEDGVEEFTPQVRGFCGVTNRDQRIKYEIFAKGLVPVQKDKYLPLERLWAYLTIKQLLDERDAADKRDDDEEQKDSPEKRALAIALKYEFVTPLTSLVVVKPNATDAINAESVHKQNDYLNPGLPLSANYAGFAARPTLFSSQSAPSAQYPESADIRYQSQSFALAGRPGLATAAVMDMDEVAIDESDYDDAFQGVSTPATTSTTEAADALVPYRLQACAWLRPLLDAATESIALPVNGTTVHLKLSKDDAAPKSSSGKDAECAKSTEGAGGVCVYLTRCAATRDLTADSYAATYCLVQNQFAGVCCPQAKVDATESKSP